MGDVCLTTYSPHRGVVAVDPPIVRTVFPERVRGKRWDAYPFRGLPEPQVELRLDEKLTVSLLLDTGYDGLLVLHYRASKLPNETELWSDTGSNTACHYVGAVNGDPQSRVVVSLCRGMLGYIESSSEGLLTIEPQDESALNDVAHPPHILRRLLPPRNETQSPKPRRNKRSYSVEQHLEVLVAADSKMARYHGKNLKHYILTLMAAVAHIYRDPSIGNLLNIALVKLVIMQEEEDREIISQSASDTLKKFCRWQQDHNHLDDTHPYHHDTAILLTREDLCRLPKTCDTLGLAQSGMICDPYSSCSIVEDNGLSAAFTIAHELGHVLNIPHDDDEKCLRHHSGSRPLHVMARMLDYNSHPWSWSSCSRHFLTAFLDAGYGECLRDAPSKDLVAGRVGTQPGELFNMDEQCELVFGPGARVCPYMPVCGRLWCTVRGNLEGGCRTQHMPWANGTPCSLHNPQKWCQKGLCIPITNEITRQAVDGEWGLWQDYGRCSRTCGGGIQSSSRECDNPRPAFGGRYCLGERVRYRSCNTQPCPVGSQDFREEQCQAFNGMTAGLPDVPAGSKWTAQYSDIARADWCKLYCRVVGRGAYYVLKEKVVDGTRCNLETFDVCINGFCKPAGCDHRLNSTAKPDMCGVCAGDNSTCKTIKGHYSRAQFGYNLVVKIPSGASYMDIRQYGAEKDDNYLALRDSQEEYLLNGNFTVSVFRKTLHYGGTLIEYSGSNASVERINATKQLESELQVMVLTVGNVVSPDIRYEYTVSVQAKQEYTWEVDDQWSQCSHICQGRRVRAGTCRHITDGVVDETKCHQHPPALAEACNGHCTLRWKISAASECSARCGPGTRTRTVQCMQVFEDGQETAVAESHCQHLGPRPPEQEKCNHPCRIFHWEYDDWQTCSKTCGSGEQIRTAVCVGDDEVAYPDARCDQAVREDRRPCNVADCPRWQVGPWTQCSVTCGEGIRRRPLWCQHEQYKVAGSFCPLATKPADSEPCRGPPCHPHPESELGTTVMTAKCPAWCLQNVTCHLPEATCVSPPECSQCPRTIWQTAPWSQCSVTCGHGVRKRRVICVNQTAGTPTTDDECVQDQKPKALEHCTLQPCHQQDGPSLAWQHGEWGPCSVTCGRGVATRWVRCSVEGAECSQDERPPGERVCQQEPCDLSVGNYVEGHRRWKVGTWGVCSRSCGGGHQRRQVICVDDMESKSSSCPLKGRPPESRACHVEDCPKWALGTWSQCNTDCGEQRRRVVCQDWAGVSQSDSRCSKPKPQEVRPCDSRDCAQPPYRWQSGAWSQCSATCGDGVMHRSVECLDGGHRPVPYVHCKEEAAPPDKRDCRLAACPRWQMSPWSPCSAPCGNGTHKRVARCMKRGREVSAESCSGPRPGSQVRPCFLRPCHYRWKKTRWTPCSATCGGGSQTRRVGCVDRGNRPVAERWCGNQRRPRVVRHCAPEPCPLAWRSGDWSECSRTCGEGVQVRRVTCHRVNTYGWLDPIPVESSTCPAEVRPTSSRSCQVGLCEEDVFWKPGPWSACSASCGLGRQKRRLRCYDSHNKRVHNSKCRAALKRKLGRKRKCFLRPCGALSCQEFQDRMGVRTDGEQEIYVRGRAVSLYCGRMNTTSPQEYISLSSGESSNYSEVYGKRLANPDTCPYGGARVDYCDCLDDYPAGLTTFSKVALNMSSLQVDLQDLTYSRTLHGRPVGFAEAGDCYSRTQCPQGRFSVSLAGTGFAVDAQTKWITQGAHATIAIRRLEGGEVIQGRCGGYCGKCFPDATTGLLLDVRPP
ncbi:A disintegrin and metalloproteinase with thrombospondin motifs 9-like isoform X2 [Ornithodoros turicata]|uniref:A disintegrin and metalloproteinase with thrombospondin motifs 9-like isoform X2 n=1 Tax=Ornithodoros turicata TaxID=34597 RepID=UPI003139D8A6